MNIKNTQIIIKSSHGKYQVHFVKNIESFKHYLEGESRLYFLIDEKVLNTNAQTIKRIARNQNSIVTVRANEQAKQFSNLARVINKLQIQGIRRGDTLVAVGGGVIQDIVGFIASILFRGIDWVFIPTTLAAQADSCIGSKTSINFQNKKNILGNFYPPKYILIFPNFCETLEDKHFNAGIGEMLKIHAIKSLSSFLLFAEKQIKLKQSRNELHNAIHQSLILKKYFIEKDEFDKGQRLLLNYGHSFGHALEAATNFKIPHGVAITLGMDIANFISYNNNFSSNEYHKTMHESLLINSQNFLRTKIDWKKFKIALLADKKNTSTEYTFILPNTKNKLMLTRVNFNVNIVDQVRVYWTKISR